MQTTPAPGTGRPPAAQFARRPVSIPGARTASYGEKVIRSGNRGLDRPSPGRGRRRVPRADRAAPPGAAGALLPDARIPGPLQDAEDAVQDTLLAAWQGLGGFEGRASLRTWLYRIATNRCLNARRAASRRPAKEWDVPNVEPPEPTRLGEVVWLEPYPDVLLAGAAGVAPGPEARYEQTEAVSLAFVTTLQVLPPRQLAVLILRDVLGFHASEVAGMLDSTTESVNSALKRARSSGRAQAGALKRARASLARRQPPAGREPPPAAGSPAEDAIVAKFTRAWESADLDALVALLTDDVFISMPPLPFEYEGRDVVPLLRQPLRHGPAVRPHPGAGQPPASVRRLPARPQRHQPRDRPVRPHPRRRPDLRHDPLRQQRPPVVRSTALAPALAGVPITRRGFRWLLRRRAGSRNRAGGRSGRAGP
ncbi:MAG TPA: sigma-70 family RNA polymerase sigma factor [Trebonia sp.]|nr:sigma-70 family RNA polymerase sigma factor [Trebonia sp.]